MITPINSQPSQPVFKGIALKKISPNDEFERLIEFVQAGSPERIIKGSNRRMNRDVLTLDITTFEYPVVRCMKPKIEEEVFNNLNAQRDMLPGVEIHKIDDWA